jgi:hypothetical protein
MVGTLSFRGAFPQRRGPPAYGGNLGHFDVPDHTTEILTAGLSRPQDDNDGGLGAVCRSLTRNQEL